MLNTCLHSRTKPNVSFCLLFKSGSSGKPGRSRQNAGICVEEIVAYRAFGIAETFLGHQVNASTTACFTRSLNYIHILPLLGPTQTISNRRSKWESMRILTSHPHCVDRMHFTRSFYGICICHRVAKAARWLRWTGLIVIGLILSCFFFIRVIIKSYSRKEVILKTDIWCPTIATALFF